jgi:hypothetical protein
MGYWERAEAIFERSIGYKLRMYEYTDTLQYGAQGAVIRNDQVIEILSVRAKASMWEYENFFGNTDWVDIDLGEIVQTEKDGFIYLYLPPTLFGTLYHSVEVTYIAGYSEIPEEIILAIQEIASLLKSGQITEWNCIMPVSVLDVIDKYRKEVID